jgi:hypothetical protein
MEGVVASHRPSWLRRVAARLVGASIVLACLAPAQGALGAEQPLLLLAIVVDSQADRDAIRRVIGERLASAYEVRLVAPPRDLRRNSVRRLIRDEDAVGLAIYLVSRSRQQDGQLRFSGVVRAFDREASMRTIVCAGRAALAGARDGEALDLDVRDLAWMLPEPERAEQEPDAVEPVVPPPASPSPPPSPPRWQDPPPAPPDTLGVSTSLWTLPLDVTLQRFAGDGRPLDRQPLGSRWYTYGAALTSRSHDGISTLDFGFSVAPAGNTTVWLGEVAGRLGQRLYVGHGLMYALLAQPTVFAVNGKATTGNVIDTNASYWIGLGLRDTTESLGWFAEGGWLFQGGISKTELGKASRVNDLVPLSAPIARGGLVLRF